MILFKGGKDFIFLIVRIHKVHFFMQMVNKLNQNK